jgi:bifunctional non-homologous end joining protein LigD
MASLAEYRRKRQFRATPEPRGKTRPAEGNQFVVQEHHARRLHWDFRLEVDGVMKSWAVPKGPSLNPADKRLAIQTEDHPIEYNKFEGTIPAGHYGAGTVSIWDAGTFELERPAPAREQIERGELKFILHGKRLRGSFVLVRIRPRERTDKREWLLIKHKDESADPNWRIEENSEPLPAGKKSSRDASAEPSHRKAERKTKGAPRNLEMPAGAMRAEMPKTMHPALATLVDKPFSNPDWLFEIKWDGARTLAHVRDGKVRLWSRSNRDVSREYPELASIAEHLNAREAWLDGEIVVLDEDGRSNFEKLQLRFGVQEPSERLIAQVPVVYYVFDILYCDGYDLRRVPLIERKNFLKQVLREGGRVRYSDHVIENGKELYEVALERNLEGLVAKRVSSPYPEGRSPLWLKMKLTRDVDTVVGGWTDPRGAREHFGALLAGIYDGDELQFVGGVGTGFSVEMQKRVWEQLQRLKSNECLFATEPETREKAHWVRPELVARVKFDGWTEGRQLRAPRFLGFQEDRDPKRCTFDDAMRESAQAGRPAEAAEKPVRSKTRSWKRWRPRRD